MSANIFSTAKGVIFDCDGTLLDSLDMWGQLEADMCERAGVELTKELGDLLTTLTLPESAAWFHQQGYLGSAQEVADEMYAYLMDYYEHRAQAKPGAVELVRSLHERGVKLTLASSTPHAQLEAAVRGMGLQDCFMAIVSTDDVGAPKRQPKIYEHCRQIMGTSLEDTWGVEDATYALCTLKEAGYKAVGIFDRDVSGTWDDISRLADIAIRSWSDPADLAKLSYNSTHQ